MFSILSFVFKTLKNYHFTENTFQHRMELAIGHTSHHRLHENSSVKSMSLQNPIATIATIRVLDNHVTVSRSHGLTLTDSFHTHSITRLYAKLVQAHIDDSELAPLYVRMFFTTDIWNDKLEYWITVRHGLQLTFLLRFITVIPKFNIKLS